MGIPNQSNFFIVKRMERIQEMMNAEWVRLGKAGPPRKPVSEVDELEMVFNALHSEINMVKLGRNDDSLFVGGGPWR